MGKANRIRDVWVSQYILPFNKPYFINIWNIWIMNEEATLDGAKRSQLEDGKIEANMKDVSEFINDSTWTGSRAKTSRKKDDEEEYARRFLTVRKVKDYTPVYIDVRMKEKLQTLVSSLQHIVPDITPTILLSNILADHLLANRELITRSASEGLKRSLASTFNNDKE